MNLVVRDDLSKRTALSKSTLTEFDICQQKSWFSIHDRRPVVPNERMTFGSAVDAAVEQIAVFLRSGQTVEMARVMAAAEEVIARDEVAVDAAEVERAAERFVTDIAPRYDWNLVTTQASLSTVLDHLGEVAGHPDLIFKGPRVRDVKTSKRAKSEEPTLEHGMYVLLVEAATGSTVLDVGYLCWVRVGKPYWQEVVLPVTDELRRWTLARAGAYVRAKNADALWNSRKGAGDPENVSFPGGPAWMGACSDCQYAPANGGSCAIAYREEAA